MPEPKACIYILFFPDGVYIGRTKNLKQRLQDHRRPSSWGVLETTLNRMETCKAEIKWMEIFQGFGVTLLNKTKASCGSYDTPQYVREKIRIANTGKRMSLQARQKMSAWQKGVPKHYPVDKSGLEIGWQMWKSLTKEERSLRMKAHMTDSQREGLKRGWEHWANLTPDQKSEIRKRTCTRNVKIAAKINYCPQEFAIPC